MGARNFGEGGGPVGLEVGQGSKHLAYMYGGRFVTDVV